MNKSPAKGSAKKPAQKPVQTPAQKAIVKKAVAKPALSKAPVAKKAAPKPVPAKKVPANKPVTKPVAKVALTKAPAKKAPPPAAKKPVAPAAKAPVAKSLAKPLAKPVAKPLAKTVAKSAAKAAAKPVTPPKNQAPSKAASKSVTPPLSKALQANSPVRALAPAPVPTAPTPAPVKTAPAKTGRGKNALTAPSMAPAVASTAAKASYSMTASMHTEPLIVPPIVAAKKDPKLANNWKTKTAEQMTDAELMAMPDAEYMNDKQMAYFRLKLVGLKRDILENADETTEHLREDTVIVPDPADRATIEEEHALELRTRDRERKLLKKIEQSITRIDAGDYGYCDETGEAIGVGRLLARPTATLSLEAQQRRELKQKMFGD